MVKMRLPIRRTPILPKVSEKDDMKNGPSAQLSRYMDRTSCKSMPRGMLRSAPILSSEGAAMDDESCDTRAKLETIRDICYGRTISVVHTMEFKVPRGGVTLTLHFLALLQFLGLLGSAGPLHVTCTQHVSGGVGRRLVACHTSSGSRPLSSVTVWQDSCDMIEHGLSSMSERFSDMGSVATRVTAEEARDSDSTSFLYTDGGTKQGVILAAEEDDVTRTG